MDSFSRDGPERPDQRLVCRHLQDFAKQQVCGVGPPRMAPRPASRVPYSARRVRRQVLQARSPQGARFQCSFLISCSSSSGLRVLLPPMISFA